jgi:DNA polymerase III subunit delta'
MPNRADQALKLIARAKQHGRLSHAYLITGPNEVDREGFATRFLNLVANRQIATLDDWQKLGAVLLRPQSKSRKIIIGESADEHGTVRYFNHVINMTMLVDGGKFGVVVDADRMNHQAQNAFLKTLEEPPPNTLLLLLTGKPEELLPTIRSRVIEIGLVAEPGSRKFSEHEQNLLALLDNHCKKNASGVAGALALKAGFEEVLDSLREEVEEELEDDFEREKELYKQTTDSGAYLKDKEDKMKALIESNYLQQRDALIELMLAWVGDVIRLKVNADYIDLPEARSTTAAMAERWTIDDAMKRLHAMRKLEGNLHTNVNEALALEVGFMDTFG